MFTLSPPPPPPPPTPPKKKKSHSNFQLSRLLFPHQNFSHCLPPSQPSSNFYTVLFPYSLPIPPRAVRVRGMPPPMESPYPVFMDPDGRTPYYYPLLPPPPGPVMYGLGPGGFYQDDRMAVGFPESSGYPSPFVAPSKRVGYQSNVLAKRHLSISTILRWRRTIT